MTKKRLAREWLYFLVFIIPWIAFLVAARVDVFSGTSSYGLIGRSRNAWDILLGILIVLGPYLAFWFIRSMIWAVKTATSKEE